ncbi:MAG: CHRD domain-containing protein [Dehalococcoidia bacterium]
MRYLNIVRLRLALAMLVLATALFAYSADSAEASSLFRAELDGAQEVPPTASPATGTATVVLNDAETMASITLAFTASELLSPQIDAHIHGPAAPGVDGPIVFPLPTQGGFVGLPWPLTPADVANLKAGLLYINVHTVTNPGGEIRGQLLEASVGGTVEFADDQSGAVPAESGESSGGLSLPLAGAIAGIAAAAVATIAAGWYVRGRRPG